MRGDLEWGSIPGLVRAAARGTADREAVVEGRTRISYAELGDRVERAAAACIASGVEPGDRVAVWAPNTLDWIVSALGRGHGGRGPGPAQHPLQGHGGGVHPAAQPRAAALRHRHVPRARRTWRRCAAAEVPNCPHLEQVVVLADAAPEDYRTWKDFLAGGRADVAGGGTRHGRPRSRPVLALGHHLHLGHHGPPQGRRDHPRPDAARLRDLERTGRPARGRPLSDREPVLPHLRLQGGHHRLPDARRDDGPAAGVQRGHGPRQHRRRTHLRPPRPAHPPPVAPGPPGPGRARPLARCAWW